MPMQMLDKAVVRVFKDDIFKRGFNVLVSEVLGSYKRQLETSMDMNEILHARGAIKAFKTLDFNIQKLIEESEDDE